MPYPEVTKREWGWLYGGDQYYVFGQDIGVGGAGDLLILMVGTNQTNVEPTDLTDWDHYYSGKYRYHQIFIKVTDGDETDAIYIGDIEENEGSYTSFTWRIAAGTWLDYEVGGLETQLTTSPNPSELAPSWDPSHTLWIATFGGIINDDPVSCTQWPEGTDNQRFQYQATYHTSGIGAAEKEEKAASWDPTSFHVTGVPSREFGTAVVAVQGTPYEGGGFGGFG